MYSIEEVRKNYKRFPDAKIENIARNRRLSQDSGIWLLVKINTAAHSGMRPTISQHYDFGYPVSGPLKIEYRLETFYH